jgi:hypothetical protein
MAASLAQKLQIKTGRALAVLNAPPGYLARLAAELEGTSVSAGPTGQSDALLLFVNSLAEAAQWVPEAIRAVKADGLLWIAYPKGTSGVKTDVNRDRLWQAVEPTGWRPVRQIALDEDWSAMRLRPSDQVGR